MATSRRTSVSRSVSSGIGRVAPAGARLGLGRHAAIRRNSPSTRPASPGVKTASPRAVARTASTNSLPEGRLHEVAGGAGLDRREHVVLLAAGREDEHPGLQVTEGPAHLVAAQPGQVEVEHEHVGPGGPGPAHGRRAVGGRGDDVEAGSARSRSSAAATAGGRRRRARSGPVRSTSGAWSVMGSPGGGRCGWSVMRTLARDGDEHDAAGAGSGDRRRRCLRGRRPGRGSTGSRRDVRARGAERSAGRPRPRCRARSP